MDVLRDLFVYLRHGYPEKDIIFEPLADIPATVRTVACTLELDLPRVAIRLGFHLKIEETPTELIVYGIRPYQLS